MECHFLASARQSLLRSTPRLHTRIRPSSLTCSTHPRHYSASPTLLHTHPPNAKTNLDSANIPQAYPLTGYYSDILSARSRHRGQATTSSAAPRQQKTTSPPAVTETPTTPQERMAIVFGTRLAGPGRASRHGPGQEPVWKTINGVAIPPRPEEPDNCCMSGCVNCVWDSYRDEMEEWAALLAQAKAKGPAAALPDSALGPEPDAVSASMDDDGGGIETNWCVPGAGDDLFADIPVGIREFMKTEKKLKQLHQQEAHV